MTLIHIYTREDALGDGTLIRWEDYVRGEGGEDNEEAVEFAVSGIRQDPKAKFPLGEVVITPGAASRIHVAEALNCLTRHQRGDWGICCEEDRLLNDEALVNGERLFSVFHAARRLEGENKTTRFYVITEWNREATTILLPEDY